ncbi:unnamed protein product, partial [Hapterophycus canaliculatus]
VSAVLALHATPASSLAFSFRVANGSMDHADHHQRQHEAHPSHGAGGSRQWPPVCLRRGRERGSSLFARLKASALSIEPGGRGGAGGGRGAGGGGEGGRAGSRVKLSASTAATGVPKEDEPFVFEGVKNIRDVSSVEGYGIAAGRLFRTGHLSAATEKDARTLRDNTALRTLVDLRSGTELGKDELIHGDVYEGFVNVGGGEHGGTGVWEGPAWDEAILEESAGALSGGTSVEGKDGGGSRRRYFISLIDESIYKKGVFQRLSRRHKAAVMALAPATMVSRRCTQKARSIFLREINDGGLVLLNELLLQYSGDGINRVLRLLASEDRHPVALYCTAGKDRTGLVVALTLAVLGVPDEAIVDDYAKSELAYRELADRDAMVGALSQEDLDPETFLGAPPHVMEDVLRFIRVR